MLLHVGAMYLFDTAAIERKVYETKSGKEFIPKSFVEKKHGEVRAVVLGRYCVGNRVDGLIELFCDTNHENFELDVLCVRISARISAEWQSAVSGRPCGCLATSTSGTRAICRSSALGEMPGATHL